MTQPILPAPSPAPAPAPHHPVLHPADRLPPGDQAALADLYVRGTPANTARAYARDLAYLTAWKAATFAAPLSWPETDAVALRFLLDHARDLAMAAATDPARQVAETLIGAGLRRSLDCPAPATLDRRIASWRALHRMRDLSSPFETPLLRQARAKARRAAQRTPTPKSAHPITRDILLRAAAAAGPGLRGLRDRAIVMLGWASGGRRRSEIAGLMRADIGLDDVTTSGVVWIALLATKTTRPGRTPRLVLKGPAARAVLAWIDAAGITDGPLFRRITRTGAVGGKALSAAGVGQIVKRLLQQAGLGADFASAHGLRSGFLTQAALDGAPIQAAMRLSLHRSVAQAQRYYDDITISTNPATDLLGD